MQEEKQSRQSYIKFLEKMDRFVQRFLLLKPRFIDEYPLLSVEGVVCGEESFRRQEGVDGGENPYILGFAFDIETCSDYQDEPRKIGDIEGIFYNVDQVRADGIKLKDALHCCVNEHPYDAFEAMGIPEKLTDAEAKKCLNVFCIEKFSIEPDETRHGIGTATLWSLADIISHYFNRRIRLILFNVNDILPYPFPWAGFTRDFPTKEELAAYETAKVGLREFIAKVGFHPILDNDVWYFDTENDRPNFEKRAYPGPDETLTHLAIME